MTLKTFSIQNKSGMTYLAKIDTASSTYGIEIGNIDGVKEEVLLKFSPVSDFITLINPWILAPQRTATGVQVIPTRLSESPNGSETIVMRVDNIADLNLIDDNSALLTAMRASESGLELAGSNSEIEKSSRVINKFGR